MHGASYYWVYQLAPVTILVHCFEMALNTSSVFAHTYRMLFFYMALVYDSKVLSPLSAELSVPTVLNSQPGALISMAQHHVLRTQFYEFN